MCFLNEWESLIHDPGNWGHGQFIFIKSCISCKKSSFNLVELNLRTKKQCETNVNII